MNKIGMHIHNLNSEVFEAVKLLKPLGVVILNPTPQWIKDVRSYTNYIGVRKFEDGVPFWDRNPEGWADSIASMCGDALELIDGAIVYNEPMPQGHDNPDHFPLFDDWQARIINRLQDTHGMDALAFPFGTGQFTAAEDRVRLDVAFPQSCEVCKIISPHDYDWPNIWKSEGWRAMRWLAWLDDIEEAGYGRKEVIVSEWGLTQATYGGDDIGWRSGVSQEDYLNQMSEYNARLCAMPEVRFFTPFDWGGSGAYGRDTFEHVPPGDDSVVQSIFSIVCPEAPPEPPEPNGGGKMHVYDFDHGPGSGAPSMGMDWLAGVFGTGLKIHPVTEKVNLQPGDHYYKVVYLDARVGDSNCIINVRDISGNPMYQETVVFWWASAEPHGLPAKPSNWTDNGADGDTNPEGDVGPGMGPGAYYDKNSPDGGPHKVWVYDKPSELVAGVGMLAGGDPLGDGSNKGPHAHVNIGYQEAIWEDGGGNGNGDEPEPPTPPSEMEGSVSDLLDELESQLLGLDTDAILATISQIRTLLWG